MILSINHSQNTVSRTWDTDWRWLWFFNKKDYVYKMLQLVFSLNGLTFWLEKPTSKQSSCSCSVTYLMISETAWVTGILWIAASRRNCSVTALKKNCIYISYYYLIIATWKFSRKLFSHTSSTNILHYYFFCMEKFKIQTTHIYLCCCKLLAKISICAVSDKPMLTVLYYLGWV